MKKRLLLALACLLLACLLAGCAAPVVRQLPSVTEAPTPTAVPALTETPPPAETPAPVVTAAPAPAETPAPVETAAPAPAETPAPVETAAPPPTETPVPVVTAAPAEPTASPAPVTPPAPSAAAVTLPAAFESYDELYQLVSSLTASAWYPGRYLLNGDVLMEADAAMPAPTPMPSGKAEAAAEPAMPESSAGADSYSGTNVQVAGVDEGDVVKTDGEYIYVLRGSKLTILRPTADGVETLSETELGGETYACGPAEQDGPDGKELDEDGSWRSHSHSRNPQTMYLYGDTLAVICANWQSSEGYDAKLDRWSWSSRDYVTAHLWDVSDPAAPVCTANFGQDGSYSDSRLYQGKLYLVSAWTPWQLDAGDPRSFVPCLYDGTAETLAPLEDLSRGVCADSASYLVLRAIDVASGKALSSLSVLGGGSASLYMNQQNLYLAQQNWSEETAPAGTDSVYTVETYRSGYRTLLSRIPLDGEDLAVAAAGSVRGRILGQFAMDEYQGCFRIVTTTEDNEYKIYTDERFGFRNFVYPENGSPRSSGLYILDQALTLLGSVTGLGETEQVQSVRFSGDIGYFVTFRQTDPLFAVDLQDPTAPKVLSALKIPGFSAYLHGYGEGLLLGVGYDADENTGWRQGVKLSMFDVRDPANVTEAAVTILDSGYSPVCDNHHAALIDVEKNLIAFPADSEYLVYAYTDGAFQRLAAIPLNYWSWNTRGLYIGDRLYIVAEDRVVTLSMADWTQLSVCYF